MRQEIDLILKSVSAIEEPLAFISYCDNDDSESTFRDWDFVVDNNSIDRVSEKLMNLFTTQGNRLINIIYNDYCTQLYFWKPETRQIFQIDLLPHLSYRGLRFLDIPAPPPGSTAYEVDESTISAYAIIRSVLWGGGIKNKYEHLIRKVETKDPERLRHYLTEAFGEDAVKSLLPYNGEFDRNRLKFIFVWRCLTRAPIGSLSGFASHVYYSIWRRVNYPGLVLTFLGPDGSGKSTIIRNLIGHSNLFKNHQTYYLFPGFLPMYQKKVGGPINAQPHSVTLRGNTTSIVKLALWLIEYILGYIFLLTRPLREGRVLVFDRYFHDVLVDPIRYRISTPAWIISLMARIVPHPDLILIMDAPTEVTFERKQELSKSKIDELRKAYRAFHLRYKNSALFDTSKPLPILVAEIEDAIVSILETRAQRRRKRRT